jgi:hypothetical protein
MKFDRVFPATNINPYKPSGHVFASPTWSFASRDKWASRIVSALETLHEMLPPSFFVTIKPNQRLKKKQVSEFFKALSKAVEYKNRAERGTGHISYFCFPEINKNNFLHFHFLIRTTGIDAETMFNGFIKRYNKKHKMNFSMPYIEPPDSPEACTLYFSKLGRRDIKMFQSTSLTKYTFTGGKYFLNFKRKKLIRIARFNYWLRMAEMKAEEICKEWPPDFDTEIKTDGN